MIKNYLNIALRNLQKRPFYTAINILGLAVGMASALLISVYIVQEMSYDRFHEKADRIYRLNSHLLMGETEFHGAAVSPAVAGTFKEEVTAVEKVVRMATFDNKIFKKGEITIKEDNVLAADPDFFSIFSFLLTVGDSEKVLQEPNSVVMTREAARKYFQEENPVGQSLMIDGKPFQISGIMEPVPQASHVHFDIVYSFLSEPRSKVENWGNINTATYFLLREGASIEEVEAALVPLMKKHMKEYDQLQEMGYSIEMASQALTDIHLHSQLMGEFEPNGNIRYLYIFGAIALFILLIACINFMNLSTARSADRAKEVGVRKTMGSARSALIRQFLAESLFISLVSVVLALGLTELLRIPFSQMAAREILLPFASWWFLPSVLLLSLLVGLLAGSYPAFYLTRFNPSQVLRGRLASGSRNAWLRNSLVVFQFVISIALIVCTLMVYEQLQFVRNKELGFSKENVLVLSNGKSLGTNREAFYNAINSLAEVEAVSFSDATPFGEYDGTVFIPPVASEDGSGNTFRDEDAKVMSYLRVSHDYLAAMGIHLKEGRHFSREIAADSANYAVILNESAVRRLALQQTIGNKIMIDGDRVAEVVGVVEDYHFKSLHSEVEPLVLVLSDYQNYVQLKLRSDDLSRTLTDIEAHWKQYTGGMPLDYTFLDEDFDALFRADQRVGMIFGGFTSLAILIACLGLLALAAFMAEQRTKEIGVRKVMGASVRHIVLLLTKDFTRLVLIAFVVAVPLAYFAVQQWLKEFAYRIDIGITSFIISGILALFVAWLTVSWQSYRAAVADPVKSLRNE